jgi:hypothetical protein
MQLPLVEYSHCHQHSTATSNLHTLQTHTFFVSLSLHSRLTTDNSTATTGATQPPPMQYSHHWWNIPIAAGTAQPPAIYAQTHSLPIHSGHPSILIMHGKSYCYQHNLCWHTTATAGNTATGAGAAQPPPATCTYLFEQHLHGLHPCLQHFGDSHHCNASTSGAMQPPPVIPILSFLLSLWHFQHTTNSCHCNPTTSGAAQPLVISPLPFPSPPQMFPTHLTGHTPNGNLN